MKFTFVLITVWLLVSCTTEQQPNRIYYLNSYHAGYASSDAVEKLVREKLDREGLTLKVSYLNGKLLQSDSLKLAQAAHILEDIRLFEPDIILVSDDDAIKYVIEPYFENSETPVLFCGVNWSKDQYALNNDLVRGMLEVLPLGGCIDTVKNYFPEVKRIGILSENSVSEHSNKRLLDSLYRHRGLTPSYALVDSFSQWVDAFRHMNETVDLIYIPTNGGILNWDAQVAKDLLAAEIRVPIITCESFMMSYAVFGMTRVLEEQGEWLTMAADQLLAGKAITSIQNTKNVRVEYHLNEKLAEVIKFDPSPELMKSIY